MSLTNGEDVVILREVERGSNGCLYCYRLLRTGSEPLGLSVAVSFRDAKGYATEEQAPLPLCDAEKAERLLTELARTLVTPIDLPYVLEDAFTV